MTESMSVDDRRARVLRLLQFLHELIRAKSDVVRNVDDHEALVWLGDDNGLPVRTKAAPGERFLELRPTGAGADGFASVAAMLDDLAARPESLELVVATGLLTIGSDASADGDVPAVNQHLLTQAVVAEHDHTADTISISLAGDSVPELQDSHLLTGVEGFDLGRSGRSPICWPRSRRCSHPPSPTSSRPGAPPCRRVRCP